MNLITEKDKVFKAMTELEGEQWSKIQGDDSDYTFWGIRSQLVEMMEAAGLSVEDLHEGIFETIYGAGGINRYPVRCNGNVFFSRYHCPFEETIKKAKELGFDVF